VAWARQIGKEPSLLRKDVPGLITNRIMYAMLREAFHLVESGVASIADVDRSLRNDLGYRITFAGPFRFMDLTGIPALLDGHARSSARARLQQAGPTVDEEARPVRSTGCG
jgi:3-hydroxybutyryl-CoA dehydrogenase